MSVYENDGKPAVFDATGMMERLMDDGALARMTTEALLKDIPLRIDAFRECLNTGNVKGVECFLHTIKGISVSVTG